MNFQSTRRRGEDGVATVINFLLSNARLVLGVGGAAILGIATLAVKRVERAGRAADDEKVEQKISGLVSASPPLTQKGREGARINRVAKTTKQQKADLCQPPRSSLETQPNSDPKPKKLQLCVLTLQERLQQFYHSRAALAPHEVQRAQALALDICTEVQGFLHRRHPDMPLGEMSIGGSLLDNLQVVCADHACLLVPLELEASLWRRSLERKRCSHTRCTGWSAGSTWSTFQEDAATGTGAPRQVSVLETLLFCSVQTLRLSLSPRYLRVQRSARVHLHFTSAEGGGRGPDGPAGAHLPLGQRLAPVSVSLGDPAPGPAGRGRRRMPDKDPQNPQGRVPAEPRPAAPGGPPAGQPHPAPERRPERLVRQPPGRQVPAVRHGADRLPGARSRPQPLQACRQPAEQAVGGPGGPDGLHALLRRVRARNLAHVTRLSLGSAARIQVFTLRLLRVPGNEF
ncbi:unnamed protein product [Tetraodon nigroviridis]|uniref:(spotted green pufferfish) hypothetical protein n=1 Tax=Tetraodon nigroviridis TaxID=99883 RepID=Q4SMH9_TETNG|nr:unnamed protein product [Tetraodon nigroviridis]